MATQAFGKLPRHALASERMDRPAFLTQLWESQHGYPEVAPKDFRQRRCVHGLDEAVAYPDLAYAGPLLRKNIGGRRDDVSSAGNVLWLDLDVAVGKHEPAPAWMRQKLREQIEQVFGLGTDGPLPPSILLDTGNRGFQLFWKLSEPIPSTGPDSIEECLRGLRGLFNASRPEDASFKADSCVDCNRLLRVPGGINAVTGRKVTARRVGPVYKPDHVRTFLMQGSSRQEGERLCPRLPDARPPSPGSSTAAPLPCVPPILSTAQNRYLQVKPGRGRGWDRSAFEYGIAATLARQGWSDKQIEAFALTKVLPRTTEEYTRGRPQWLAYTIMKARTRILETHKLVTQTRGGPTYYEDDPNITFRVGTLPHRAKWSYVDRAEMLPLCFDVSPTEAVKHICDKTGRSERTAWTIIRQYRHDGYLRDEAHADDGRKKILRMTDRARQAYTFDRLGEGYSRNFMRNSLHLTPVKALNRPDPAGGSVEKRWWGTLPSQLNFSDSRESESISRQRSSSAHRNASVSGLQSVSVSYTHNVTKSFRYLSSPKETRAVHHHERVCKPP